MEQELRFELVLGRLALLKKKTFGRIMSNFRGQLFQVSVGKKNCSVRTIKLHKMKLKKYFFSKKI